MTIKLTFAIIVMMLAMALGVFHAVAPTIRSYQHGSTSVCVPGEGCVTP